MKALARDRDARHASVDALEHDLERVISGARCSSSSRGAAR
jgi:hypothetical protein